jgi:hypothetical protein
MQHEVDIERVVGREFGRSKKGNFGAMSRGDF